MSRQDTLSKYVAARDRAAAHPTPRRVARADALRAQVVQENMGLVATVAQRLTSDPSRHADCIQAGALALLLALPSYDPTRATLPGYAWLHLRGAIIRELHATNPNISLDEPLHDDGSETALDRLAAPEVEPLEPSRDVWVSELESLLASLPPEQSQLLRLRYGVGPRA